MKVGTLLTKQKGSPGVVRKVVGVERSLLGRPVRIRVEWTRTTKAEGSVTLSTWLECQEDGLPAGYVLAKDRKAVRK